MSLGKDLESIRKSLGFSLDEIQSSIKIPMYILKDIENDSIFDSVEYNKTYIRSFIRSYARGLQINDEDIVNALDAVEAGIYEHNLIASDGERKATDLEFSKTKDAETDATTFKLSNVPQPEIEQASVKQKPTLESENWADLAKKFALQKSGSKEGVLSIVIFFVIALAVTVFFFRNQIFSIFDFSDPEVTEFLEEKNPSEDDSTETAVALPPEALAQTTELETLSITRQDSVSSPNGDVLTVAVYAAFDKLEPVRITSDLNWRIDPFWMEQGEALNFDFNDTLLVRGQYSRMLLLYNGHVIENASLQYFNSDFNSILLTRSIFQEPLYSTSPPAVFPYEVGAPDSIVYRLY